MAVASPVSEPTGKEKKKTCCREREVQEHRPGQQCPCLGIQGCVQPRLGSFKVTIIYTIIRSIIFLININGVVKEFNNGVINGDFLINGLQGLLLH